MESHTSRQEQLPTYKNFKVAFEGVVGLPFPESSKEMPQEFVLPTAAYGELISAILAQEDVDLQAGSPPRERAQLVGLLNYRGQLSNTHVTVGTEERAHDLALLMNRWLRPIVGLEPKPIVSWHTHTPAHTPVINLNDVLASVLTERNAGGIYIVGSQFDVTAVMQSSAAFPKTIPMSTIGNGMRMYNDVVKLFDDSPHQLPLYPDLSLYLSAHGFGLYQWSRSKDDAVIKAARRGEFEKGITLKKI